VVTVGIEQRHINWVLDADLRGVYEAIDHAWLVKVVEHRMGDQRVVRHIRKWLKARVREDGHWRPQEEGTPQGGGATTSMWATRPRSFRTWTAMCGTGWDSGNGHA
jgi:retron-type reverse transcriptase